MTRPMRNYLGAGSRSPWGAARLTEHDERGIVKNYAHFTTASQERARPPRAPERLSPRRGTAIIRGWVRAPDFWSGERGGGIPGARILRVVPLGHRALGPFSSGADAGLLGE